MNPSEKAGKITDDVASSSSSSSNRGESVVVDCGRRRSSCGYCKSDGRTSIAHGLWPHSITVDDYQDLLDRGWRRSGSFLYKPVMERTCCPSYTIRLRADDFVPSKEQHRVSRRVQRFIDCISDTRKPVEFVEDPNTSNDTIRSACEKDSSSAAKGYLAGSNERNEEEQVINYWSEKIDNAVLKCSITGEFPGSVQLPKASVKKVLRGKRKLLDEGPDEVLLYSSSIAFQIAATLRRLQSAGKEFDQPNTEGNGPSPKVIAEKLVSFLTQIDGNSALSIRTCKGHINFYCTTNRLPLYEGVQGISVSKNDITQCGDRGCCKKSSEHTQRKRQRFEIRLKRSSFDPEEFSLYRRYQIKVHNEEPDQVTESSYKMFLVESPLIFVLPTGDGTVPPCGFGSFHQQYVLNGQLIAVGVIDVLPKCLSSKYLFWDPDFAFLSLGKYSALQEIDWIKKNKVHCPSLQYYYLGYYIHSCNKMRYKAAYRPSELLCPLRYQWIPFDIAKPLLDRKPYVVLSDSTILQNGESLPAHVSEVVLEAQHDDVGQEHLNQIDMDEDCKMIETDFESSEDESDPQNNSGASVEGENGNTGNVLVELKGARMRFKDLQQYLNPIERSDLESDLRKYMRAVGSELSSRMDYSLG